MPDLLVQDSDKNFSTWSSKEFISDEVKKSISSKNVLIVPIENFRNYPNPVFPVGTEELFHYLKDNSDNKLNVDVCIDDEDYEELALHSDLIIIGSIIVTSFVAPIVVNLISSYLEDKWLKKSKKESTQLKVEITVVDNDKGSKKFKYEGPANKFKETLNESIATKESKEIKEKKN
mgnify:CR=1 FL=1